MTTESNAEKPVPVIKPSSQGKVLHAFGDEMTIMLSGADTGGKLAAFIEVTQPGGGPPPHFHEREDEWFYVLEGSVSFFSAGQWKEAHPGDMVFAPRTSIHAFKNNTKAPTKMLIQTSPAGMEDFFAEAAVEFGKAGGPDMQRVTEIAADCGIHFVQA